MARSTHRLGTQNHCAFVSPLTALVLFATVVTFAAHCTQQWAHSLDADSDGNLAEEAKGIPIYAMSISDDEEQFLVRGFLCPWTVCRVHDGQLLHDLEWECARPSAAALSPDGQSVALGFPDGSLWIHKIKGREPVVETLSDDRLCHTTAPVDTVTYSPDGTLIASAGHGSPSVVHLWDAQSGELKQRFDCHEYRVLQLHLSRDGTRLAAAFEGDHIAVWDREISKLVRFIDGSEYQTCAVRLLPDGTGLVGCGRNGKCLLWDLVQCDAPPITLFESSREMTALDVSPDGQTVALSQVRGVVSVVSISSREQQAEWVVSSCDITNLQFSPQGNFLYISAHDGLLTLWTIPEMTHVKTWAMTRDGSLTAMPQPIGNAEFADRCVYEL